MLKSFFKDSLIYSINTFLSKGISILLIPLYTAKLLPKDYGIIDILTVFTSFINVTIALEISQGVARYFPSMQNPLMKKLYASSAMWFTIFVYSLFAILVLIIPQFFNYLITLGEASITIFRLAVLNIFITGLFYFFQEQLRWSHKTKLYSIVSIIYTIVTFSTTAFFIIFLEQKVEGYFRGMIIGGLSGTLASFYLNKEIYGLKFYFKALKKLLVFSTPLVFSSISVILTMYADRLLINYFLTLKELGLFGIAYRFASITGLLMVGIQGALIPLVYKHYNEKSTPKNIARIFDLFVLFSILLLSLIVLFSKELVLLFTHHNYYSVWPLIPIICLSNIFSIIYIFTPGLSIAKKTSYLAYINIGAAILNVFLNYLLIPLFGLYGSVCGTLLSYVFVFSLNIILSQKYYHIPYHTKNLTTVIFIFISLCTTIIFLEVRYWHLEMEFNLYQLTIKSFLFFSLMYILIQIPVYKSLFNSAIRNIIKKF